MQNNVVLYDGECRLCKSIKTKIERSDSGKLFHFISQQSERGEEIISGLDQEIQKQNSLVFIESKAVLTKSDAVLQMLKKLRKFRLFYFLIQIFPQSFRNKAYDAVAKIRMWL